MRTQQAHGVHVFGLASAAVPAGTSLTHAPVQARGGASPVGALAVLASALRGGNGADGIPGRYLGADRERLVHGLEGAAPTVRMGNDQHFSVDDRTAEHHSSRRRRVDVPVAVGHGQIHPAVPGAPALGGFLEGVDNPRSGVRGGGVVACAAGDELNGVWICTARSVGARRLRYRGGNSLGYLSTRFVHIALAARTQQAAGQEGKAS